MAEPTTAATAKASPNLCRRTRARSDACNAPRRGGHGSCGYFVISAAGLAGSSGPVWAHAVRLRLARLGTSLRAWIGSHGPTRFVSENARGGQDFLKAGGAVE